MYCRNQCITNNNGGFQWYGHEKVCVLNHVDIVHDGGFQWCGYEKDCVLNHVDIVHDGRQMNMVQYGNSINHCTHGDQEMGRL
jgi:hypothetical protein